MTRLGALRACFTSAGIDALIVSNPTNIRYLSGFTGSAGALLVERAHATLFTDGRYALQAPEEISARGAEISVVVTSKRGVPAVAAAAGDGLLLGLEATHLTWSEATAAAACTDGRAVATEGLVESLRATKDAAEVALIERAAAIADAALAEVLASLRPGVAERDFARQLNDALVLHGADRPAFDTIVAFGLNSARPHHRPGEATIGAGDLAVIDFGAEYGGYRSDMTRSFVLGEPEPRAAQLLDEVAAAQAAGVAAAAPGAATVAVDRACRSHLDGVGLGQFFTHGTGHGVGLDIHEAPAVSAQATDTLARGHVVTVEPGVYIPEFGGVRWEDTLVITEQGARPLTNAPKHPVIPIH